MILVRDYSENWNWGDASLLSKSLLSHIILPMNIVWAQEATQQVAVENQLWHGIASSGIVVQALLLSLVALSVWNWYIIFKKYNQFKVIREENQKFLGIFWNSSNLQQIHEKIDGHKDSPVARMFQMAYKELERLIGTQEPQLMSSGMENLERSLRRAQDDEIAKMESELSLLATTGSTAPFIGLLGTVIGIMNSFQDIASSGSASLAVVAPGISEALFATAIGLFAAIPAVVAYNYLVNLIKSSEHHMNGFHSDFLNIARRNFFKAQG